MSLSLEKCLRQEINSNSEYNKLTKQRKDGIIFNILNRMKIETELEQDEDEKRLLEFSMSLVE